MVAHTHVRSVPAVIARCFKGEAMGRPSRRHNKKINQLPSDGATFQWGGHPVHTYRSSVRVVIIIQIYSNGPGSQRVNSVRARELVECSEEL